MNCLYISEEQLWIKSGATSETIMSYVSNNWKNSRFLAQKRRLDGCHLWTVGGLSCGERVEHFHKASIKYDFLKTNDKYYFGLGGREEQWRHTWLDLFWVAQNGITGIKKEHFLMQNQNKPSKKWSCPIWDGLPGEAVRFLFGWYARWWWTPDFKWNEELNNVVLLGSILLTEK